MSRVQLRSYCHGLGDCHLLRIDTPTGGVFTVLIDCGIHSSAAGGSAKIARVVADIAGLTQRLDVVVATHEHWDHISGFHTADFSGFSVGEVWLAWTENPHDAQAQRLDKFKGAALTALQASADKLRALAATPADTALSTGLDALLGFNFGATGEKSRDARDAVVRLAPGNVRYLEPGAVLPLPAGVGVTAYVLGPPRDEAALGVRDGPNSYGIAAALAMADGTVPTDGDPGAPFDETEGVPLSSPPAHGHLAAFLADHYAGPAVLDPAPRADDPDPPRADQAWRRIDGDWLGAAATLALQLDDRTNNTSLVLALDLAPDHDVLLFAADAQLGNWGSWDAVKFSDGTRTADLLARTRFYKVGHHGSQNATLKAGGLEAMTHPALASFCPTDEVMAKKVGWGAIPADGVMTRLAAKGTVTRSDTLADAPLFVDYVFP